MCYNLSMPEQTFSIAENPRKINKIAFLGGAAWKEGDRVYTAAYETARLLARHGYEIVNGGGPGVMRASTMGAKMEGGKTLAVTYHPNKPKRHYEGTDPLNRADEEVVTLDYFDRTKVMLQNTDLHIVFRGSLGTLSELGMTWISSWIHEPDRKPIIMFGDFWNELLDILQKHLTISDQERAMLKVCNSPQEVLDFTRGLEDR